MPQSQPAPPVVFQDEVGDNSGISQVQAGATEIKSTGGYGKLVLTAAQAAALVASGAWANA